MASTKDTGSINDAKQDQKAIRGLERKKLELLVKIGELQLELQKTNADLYRQGVSLESALCW